MTGNTGTTGPGQAGTALGDPAAPSLGELFATASRDLSLLVHKEIELAKTELTVSVRNAGLGAGLLAAAAALILFGLVGFLFAYAYVLNFVMPLALAFFLAGLTFVVIAGALALIAKTSLSKLSPPDRTIATVKDHAAWVRHPTSTPTSRT